jgi:MEMO1 family protein
MRRDMEELVRPPTAAGSFYPHDAWRLAAMVDRLLREADVVRLDRPPFALIVPHAGYVYSGPIAAAAFGSLRCLDPMPARVVLAGPAHFVALRGAAVPEASAWRTPLGDVPIDDELRDAARRAGCAIDDVPHDPEHAIEVELPFLQRLIADDLRVLPLAVGETDPSETANLLATLRADADLLVISTDLSHYLDAATAARRDRATADAVVASEPDGIGDRAACGIHALRGLTELARRERLDVHLLDLRTSAETAGEPDRVVGYGAFVVLGRE